MGEILWRGALSLCALTGEIVLRLNCRLCGLRLQKDNCGVEVPTRLVLELGLWTELFFLLLIVILQTELQASLRRCDPFPSSLLLMASGFRCQ